MRPNSQDALVVFAHGSRIEEANEAVRRLAAETAEQSGFSVWRTAFLELGKPDLAAAVSELADEGARRVVIIPYFLTMGVHLSQDLPRMVAALRREHREIEILCSPPLDGHPALPEILAERARRVINE